MSTSVNTMRHHFPVGFMNRLRPLQRNILFKLYHNTATIYLVDMIVHESEIDIKILGNANRDNKREVYTITMHKVAGYLKCTCKDFEYRCCKEDVLCKHISFLICKVLGIFDANYFVTKKMSSDQLQYTVNVLHQNDTWRNPRISVKFVNDDFVPTILNKDDDCPICLLSFGNDCTLRCPDCKQFVHKACMMAWLTTNGSCVYCRSNTWTRFNIQVGQ